MRITDKFIDIDLYFCFIHYYNWIMTVLEVWIVNSA